MTEIRLRYLCACVAVADAVLIFAGVPLQRYSWSVAGQAAPDAHLVLLLIAANVALLLVAVCGMLASMEFLRRGLPILIRHASKFFARPSRA